MAAPQWALRLVQRVCDRYEAEAPEVTWRRSKVSPFSSGVCHEGRIVITAGSLVRDQRSVVLHELAHHLVGAEHGHSDAFYRMLFEIVQADKVVPLRFVLEREARYRVQATTTAVALGLPGAKRIARHHAQRRAIERGSWAAMEV